MAPILSDTYGIIAYQEQVMRCASDLAGFTLGEADLLRKAMGKKNAVVMQAQREQFVKGAVERGLNEKKATKVFDLMEYFAGYGFNKSHSTAYALLAYQTAYLKANYPWHFMAALLTIESQNTDKLAVYLQECNELGVPVLPPDINVSELPFTVRQEGVRFGLGAVKNVGEGAILSMLAVRAAQKKITSLDRMCEEPTCASSTSACSRAWRRPARSTRSMRRDAKWTAQPSELRRASCSRPSIARSNMAAGGRRIATTASRSCSAAAARTMTAAAIRCRPRRACRRDGLDRAAAARVREGIARPVSERPSARALFGRSEDDRREDDQRAADRAGRRDGRRHHRRAAAS